METAILIGRLFAVIYLAVGLGLILSPGHYRKMMTDFIDSPGVLYLGGLLAMVAGLLIVLHHNVWTADWTLLITLLGWAAVLKGGLILVFPGLMTDQFSRLSANTSLTTVAGVTAMLFGLFLGWFSFFA